MRNLILLSDFYVSVGESFSKLFWGSGFFFASAPNKQIQNGGTICTTGHTLAGG